MSLTIGTPEANAGMSQAIFAQLDALLSPPLQAAVDNATDPAKPGAQQALDAARDGWRKLAFAIAKGVIDHLVSNMEINGVTVSGTVNVPVSGNTGTAAPNAHFHSVAITPAVAVALSQNNNGTGRVK
ncbi:hypothetical protein JOF56_006921 [Kibdelosporangium banguiense]|uniref:Uncharacterized protein n=1 Tax=Kibdelosporangium banguiense TaxID=1365924 RepID=A0ABS4TQ49_9PSEU|nr:hypothetical protein [Kibdelosporangium banguiense]MBP2326536.1 hypothetical protein [Kibdelosporangium banguiense]